jgi:3-deoxy-D-manno-octulosonic-acid transferase
MLLYKLFLFCYPKIAKLLGLLNPKAKQWSMGQAGVWEEIANKQLSINGHPTIWIHAASYGEFEQGLPIIEAIKSKYPGYKIWLTFFSPSGYLHRKNDPAVDVITYLPFDGPENAQRFIQTVNPSLIIFIKYEFWYYYLHEANQKGIPVILSSAIFRRTQLFFKWYGGFYRKMLALFTRILVQDETSLQLIATITDDKQVLITGDTRFDRVLQTVNEKKEIDWIAQLSNHKNIIAGSTWEEDEVIISKATAHFTQFNWIIAPHLADKKNIENCKQKFINAITLSELIDSGIKHTKPMVLIIDRIGLLRTLYRYSFVSYVGGGFGKDGVHNVLEPAAYGKPVIWGHNDIKYKEAIGLRKQNGGFSIKNEAALVMHLNELLQTAGYHEQISQNASNYIMDNAGATQKSMAEISKQLDRS